ncbi:MAG: polysaccharide biosynthesis/export family protein [Phycisphaerales bacterium]|nr:polysaccharide biosynthesis/export family protein [Phycisphaerales bacterium]
MPSQEPSLNPSDTATNLISSRTSMYRLTSRVLAVAGSVFGLTMVGCESDSFIDPSVMGRWEHTPTKVPVLERIASIEDAKGDLVEISAPTPEDLYTDPRDYRVGPGDSLRIEIYDFVQTGGPPELFERVVDPVGMIELPQLGRLFVSGKSIEQVRDTIADSMKKFVADPLVGVDIRELRQQTFTVIGAIERPGPYFIPSIDYKLIEAITAGGRIDDKTKEVFIIRQVQLDERAMSPRDTRRSPLPGGTAPSRSVNNGESPSTTEPPKSGESLIDLIDQLSQPGTPATTPPSTQPGQSAPRPQSEPPIPMPDSPSNPAPAPVSPPPSSTPSPAPSPTPAPQPVQPPAPKPQEPATPPVDLPSPGMMTGYTSGPVLARRENRFGDEPSAGRGASPTIDLPDPSRTATPATGVTSPQSSWVFIDGKWVQLASSPTGRPEGKKDLPAEQRRVVAQRIIRVPFQQLMDGDTSLNIVVRPGDIIRVPALPRGEVYIAGQVNRPGVYNLSDTGRLTLLRAVTSASGGLSNLAIPERVDLIRVVGDGQQAMVRLDMRAIAEGTQPDVYLKADDMVNVGTNFWAFPLAVIRNGFRANYGFGLVVDRNFGSDIFGVPPENANFFN